MDSRQRADLDRHITGNWGEDSVQPDPVIRTIYGQNALFCTDGCGDSFKSDKDHGLIYPPGHAAASCKAKFCAYCNSDLSEASR